MDPIEKRELKRKAWLRLAAQRHRAGLLRGRVVVMSLTCFAILWAVVFAQMATGNDPVLSAKERAVATRAAATSHRAVETSDRRELEPERGTDTQAGSREEEAQAEAESAPEEEAGVEAEPLLEAEPEVEAEPEPLVTSQS